MRITIRGKDLEVTPPLREYIESKVVLPVSRLIKNVKTSELPIIDIEVGRTSRHHQKGEVYHVRADLHFNSVFAHAEIEHGDVRTACDLLRDELKREIVTRKERAIALHKRDARRVKDKIRFDPAAQLKKKGRILEEGA